LAALEFAEGLHRLISALRICDLPICLAIPC
jgi:hypothetical protein